MARDWSFFRALTSNMEMALAKTDLSIAAQYAKLDSNRARGRAIFRAISDEWHLTVKHWLAISRQKTLLEGESRAGAHDPQSAAVPRSAQSPAGGTDQAASGGQGRRGGRRAREAGHPSDDQRTLRGAAQHRLSASEPARSNG
jgi:hypothetical protein